MRFAPTAALVVASFCGLTFAAAVHAEDAGTPVAVVNGVPIPQARMDFILKMQAAQGQKDTPELRAQLKEALITREIVTQAAMSKGLDQSVEYRTQMDLARQQALVTAYVEEYLASHTPTEDEVKAEYAKVKADQFDPNGKEYKARHILVKKEADAKAIIAALAKGKKFEDLAKQKSEDIGSKNKGGELDWTDGNNLVKPFADGMKALKKGEVSKVPVQTQYGFHVIKLDDERVAQFPSYEDVKDNIQRTLVTKQRDEAIAELRKSAKVE
jgi:peptidyl-prolyl cis-trans isomerase C